MYFCKQPKVDNIYMKIRQAKIIINKNNGRPTVTPFFVLSMARATKTILGTVGFGRTQKLFRDAKICPFINNYIIIVKYI
jgi:hypothetical protein